MSSNCSNKEIKKFAIISNDDSAPSADTSLIALNANRVEIAFEGESFASSNNTVNVSFNCVSTSNGR